MAATYVKKVFNELHGIDPDYHLTIPIGIDSKSAIDTANSHKDTQRTTGRHFQTSLPLYRYGSRQLTPNRRRVDDRPLD
jgi:hypothetical protein